MSAWGVDYGGPLVDKHVDSIVEYMLGLTPTSAQKMCTIWRSQETRSLVQKPLPRIVLAATAPTARAIRP